jgi:hypothetical protein
VNLSVARYQRNAEMQSGRRNNAIGHVWYFATCYSANGVRYLKRYWNRDEYRLWV